MTREGNSCDGFCKDSFLFIGRGYHSQCRALLYRELNERGGWFNLPCSDHGSLHSYHRSGCEDAKLKKAAQKEPL